jgi:predicted metal-binding membrane protein
MGPNQRSSSRAKGLPLTEQAALRRRLQQVAESVAVELPTTAWAVLVAAADAAMPTVSAAAHRALQRSTDGEAASSVGTVGSAALENRLRHGRLLPP